MIIDHGCAQATPGIGNIAYVKDLQTEKIVTTNFRCSVFGSYYDSATGFGWVILLANLCVLNNSTEINTVEKHSKLEVA